VSVVIYFQVMRYSGGQIFVENNHVAHISYHSALEVFCYIN